MVNENAELILPDEKLAVIYKVLGPIALHERLFVMPVPPWHDLSVFNIGTLKSLGKVN